MGRYDDLDPAAAFARWRKDRDLALNRLVVERLRRDLRPLLSLRTRWPGGA